MALHLGEAEVSIRTNCHRLISINKRIVFPHTRENLVFFSQSMFMTSDNPPPKKHEISAWLEVTTLKSVASIQGFYSDVELPFSVTPEASFQQSFQPPPVWSINNSVEVFLNELAEAQTFHLIFFLVPNTQTRYNTGCLSRCQTPVFIFLVLCICVLKHMGGTILIMWVKKRGFMGVLRLVG